MSIKIRIRIGDVEIDYEGAEEFLKQKLPTLLRSVMDFHKASGGGRGGGAGVPPLTTGTIAARLKAKSGPALLLAAAAHLTLVAKKQTFSRQELLTEMKKATSYYRKSYSNNLSKYLSSAVTDGVLQETATNAYALSADTRSKLETQLADS